ncbi:MAG: ABC transporter substrate-binding protein [Chloroflexota bacterium]
MTQHQPRHHIKNTVFILLLLITALSLLISSCSTEEKPKTYRVGVLVGLDFLSFMTDGFKEGMTELGYIEDENIVYDIQVSGFDIANYQSILQKFVDDKVDLIYVFPTEASIEAKAIAENSGIPVVFDQALIEGMGLVDSIREPGGNITGVRFPGPDIAVRRFEILREVIPDATQILIPYQKGYPIVQPQLDILYPAAEAAGVTLIEAPVEIATDTASILQQVAGDTEVDAILLLAEPLLGVQEAQDAILAFANERKIPIGGLYIPVEEGYGGFFSLNTNPFESGSLAAPLADKIFQGVPAGSIPVVSAEMYLQIDYGLAQRMGLEVPEGLLVLADEVIR